MNLDIFMASHYFWQMYQHIRYSFAFYNISNIVYALPVQVIVVHLGMTLF